MATSATAAVTTDAHGNVGYDSYDECVSAVRAGEAKFYTPYTYEAPKRWKGEAAVKKMRLSEVDIPAAAANAMPVKITNYSAGACDRGVGRSNGRAGVSGELFGKYVPYAADMPVNVYMNRTGTPVRVTMQQCDNHFSGKFPTPIMPTVPAPAPELNVVEDRSMQVVTTKVTRTITPSYKVKEVLMVPSDQVKRIKIENGTAVAVQNTADTAVVIGEEATQNVIDNLELEDGVIPVTVVPDVK